MGHVCKTIRSRGPLKGRVPHALGPSPERSRRLRPPTTGTSGDQMLLCRRRNAVCSITTTTVPVRSEGSERHAGCTSPTRRKASPQGGNNKGELPCLEKHIRKLPSITKRHPRPTVPPWRRSDRAITRRLKGLDKLLTISPNRPTKHLDRPERKAVNNLADSSRRNCHKADSSIENTQVDSRRVVNKGSDDLEFGLSVTKKQAGRSGRPAVGRPGLANHRVNELFFARSQVWIRVFIRFNRFIGIGNLCQRIRSRRSNKCFANC